MHGILISQYHQGNHMRSCLSQAGRATLLAHLFKSTARDCDDPGGIQKLQAVQEVRLDTIRLRGSLGCRWNRQPREDIQCPLRLAA